VIGLEINSKGDNKMSSGLCRLIIIAVMLLVSNVCHASIYGTINIVAEDDNAEIYLNGAYVGKKIVNIDRLSPGLHKVEVKAGNRTIYNKSILLQEGRQTNISIDKKIIDFPIIMDIGYGSYVFGKNMPDYISTNDPNPISIGFGFKNSFLDSRDISYVVGAHFNGRIDAGQITYGYADLCIENDMAFTQFGINYPYWDTGSSYSIKGKIGYQAMAGFKVTNNISIGLKLVNINGKAEKDDTYSDVSIYNSVAFIRIQ
jgi:hypothetical protein